LSFGLGLSLVTWNLGLGLDFETLSIGLGLSLELFSVDYIEVNRSNERKRLNYYIYNETDI